MSFSSKLLTGVGDYRSRKLAFTLAFVLFILDIGVAYWLNWEMISKMRPIIHMSIASLLILAVTAKEKLDDERIQHVRLVAFRQMIMLLIPIFGLLVYLVNFFDFQIQPIWVFRVLEIVLVLNYLVYKYLLNKNPKWLFEEKVISSKFSKVIIWVAAGISVQALLIALLYELLIY